MNNLPVINGESSSLLLHSFDTAMQAWSSSNGVLNGIVHRTVNVSMGTGSSRARCGSTAVNELSQGPLPGPSHINPVSAFVFVFYNGNVHYD